MIVDFNLLDDSSRVWIFQSDKIISDDKIDLIKSKLKIFLPNWSSHGKELKCSFEIKFNLFIIIGVDSSVNNASGCSIDTLTNFIFDIQSKTDLNFFNRLAIAYKLNDKTCINSMSKIKEMIKTNMAKKYLLISSKSKLIFEKISLFIKIFLGRLNERI